MKGRDKRWLGILAPMTMLLLLSGCLFRPPDDLYQQPEKSAGYEQLNAAITEVRISLEAEYGTGTENAVIMAGDNTATIQLQDLDGDGTRESAVTFLRVPGVEKSLKLYIFRLIGGEYRVVGIVEGDGAAIYSVDYLDLDGQGGKDLVVNWQISTGVYQLGAYALDESLFWGTVEEAEQDYRNLPAWHDRTQLLATELLLTGCSGASDGSSGYKLLDINQDTKTEIAVVRMDAAGVGSHVELYGWQDNSLASIAMVGLSGGASALARVQANYLQGALYPPALYITSTLADGSRVIDVVAYQGQKLCNLALAPGETVSQDRLQGYTEISPIDINGDYVLELPAPGVLPAPALQPSSGNAASTSNFWIIDWNQYDERGQRSRVLTTYHNMADGWYLVLPDSWKDKITLSRSDQLSGQREVIFSLWQGEGKEPVPFLSIYRLTGVNRVARSTRGGRFVLREESTVIYAAQFYECNWNYELDAAGLLDHFRTIQSSWFSE